MNVGVVAYNSDRSIMVNKPTPADSSSSPARMGQRTKLHVGFATVGELKEKKEKYLTAKYGAHQMALIRKRLSVEMWVFDNLQQLYQNQKTQESPVSGKTTSDSAKETSKEKEIDLDELLDIEGDAARKKHLEQLLSDCKQPPAVVQTFIMETLERAKTL